MKKFITLLIGTFLIGISLFEIISSQAIIGVSPAELYYNDVLRGGYSERTIVVLANSAEPVDIEVEGLGVLKNWFNFTKSFTIDGGQSHQLLVSVTPPIGTPNGNYTGFVRVNMISRGQTGDGGNAVGIVRGALDVYVIVEVTDVEVRKCSIREWNAVSSEKGDEVIFDILYRNDGNVRMKPRMNADIWDQEQIRIVTSKEFVDNDVLPTKDQRLQFKLETNNLDVDQYFAELEFEECFASSVVTFDVLEPGTLRANGILTRISTLPWSYAGDTVLITANFQNVGEKNVDSQFKGKITLDNKIVQILESEKLETVKGDMTNFTFYFTSKEKGKYVISGRVFYDKKRTFETSTSIDVITKKISVSKYIKILLYSIIILIILFLLFKIRSERRKMMSK